MLSDSCPEAGSPAINTGTPPAEHEVNAPVNAQPWALRSRLTQDAFIARCRAEGRAATHLDWLEHIALDDDELALLDDMLTVPVERSLAELAPYFVIRAYGDKARVGWFDAHGELATMSFNEFKNAHIEKVTQVGVNDNGEPVFKPLVLHWLQHRRTPRYDHVEFRPGIEQANMPEGVLNLWRGWPLGLQPGWDDYRLTPSGPVPVDNGIFDGPEMPPGYCDMFLDHMLNAMCGGDHELMHYLLGWMADGLWNPGPCETAIVLRGPEGSGKTLWSKHYMEFFGLHAVTLADPRHIIGNFNKQLMNKSVVFAEEAFFAKNGGHVAKLKSLVTDNELIIEPKGVDSFRVEKMFRLIMASNDEHVIGAGRDDRRYLVLNVDAGPHNQDKPHFRALVEEWRGGGRKALFRWLTGAWWGRAVGGGAFRQWERPVTAALQAQKDHSLTPAPRLIHNMLRDGEVPGLFAADAKQGLVFVATRALQEAQRLGEEHERALGDALRVLAGADAKSVREYLGEGHARRQWRGFWLPPLGECRRRWETHLGRTVEWPEDVATWGLEARPPKPEPEDDLPF